MPKFTKYTLLTFFILAAAGLVVAGLYVNTYNYYHPLAKKAQVQQTSVPADPETLVDERVLKAGDDLMEEKAADSTVRKYHASFYTRYLAADGTYQPIDAKLVKSSQADYAFENTKNVFQSYFKSDAASPDLVKYQVAGGRAVSFSFIGANKASATTSGDTITYADALSGLDAKYTVSSEMLLEELIAKKKIQIDKISQRLNLQGVYFKEEANGTLTFHDSQTKAIVFYAAKPVMYEQNDTSKKNYGLHYEIEEPDGGFIISKVIDQAGQDWLGQASYPVVIDFSFYPVPPSNPYIRPPTGTTSLTLQFTGNAFPTGAVNPYYIVQGSTDGTTWADVCDVPASVSGTVACANVPANSVTCSSGTCSATTSGVYQVIQNSLGINSKHYFRVGNYMTLSFGTGGQLALGVSDIAADATFVYDSHLGAQWGIEKRYAVTGQLDTTFGTNGVATVTTGTVSAITKDATYIYVAGIISGSSPANQWFVEKRLLSTGALVTAFDGDGILLLPRYTSVSDIIVDGSFVYIAGGDNSSGSSRGFVEKRNIGNGTAAAGYSFVLNAALIASNRIAIDASSIYITGIYASGSSRCWGGEKRVIGTGALDTTFLGTGSFIETGGTNCIGVVSSTTAVALDATNAYFVGGYGKVEKRLKTTGALVTAFDGDGMKTSTVVYRINDAFISGSSLYIAGDAQTSIALVAEILNSTTGASAGSMTSQRAWSPIEMVYDSGSYVYVADTSIVEKRNLSNLTLVSPVDCSPRSNCLSAANGDWRSSSPIFRYTRPLGVQTAMSSSLVFSSPDWQTIQIDSGTIPTYSINPANTHYCLGVSFGTDWPAVSGPDTLYSTSASLLFPGAALVYPKISETGFSQDWVDDVLAAPIQAACYTQAGWNTPTKLPWEIDGDYSSGMRFAPDRAYTLGMYSQNGQNELSPNNNPVCSTGSGSYTTQAACTAGGGSWLYSADNYVWPTSLPATHYKTIYTRARNAPVPTVTALSTTQLNVVMDSSCGSSNSSNANTTDYALYNSSTSQYYNIPTPGFDSTEHWYDCNNGSGTWNGSTGVTINTSTPNTCYTLKGRTRNGDSLCGETSGGLCTDGTSGWSGSTGTLVCTLAAVPGISVSCNYNSTDQYFCNATVSANGNPAGTQYQVEMYDTVASSWTVVQAWGTGTSVKQTSLMCRYSPVQFRVKARNTSGTETAYSTGSDALPPCPPLSFAVAGRQIASPPPLIAWSWSAPIAGVAPTSYNFYDTSDSSKNQTGATSIYYETVDPNTQHTAYATAVANGKEGAPSNTASTWEYAMTPGITLNCTTKQVSITTGTDPYYNPSTTQYHLQYTTDGGTTWTEADSGWQTYTETNHVITRAFNGTGCNLTYQYHVKARNGANEEAPSGASWSTSNTCTMPPDPPTWSSPNHSTQTASSITWQWTAPSCAVASAGYNVYDCSGTKKNSTLVSSLFWTEPSLSANTSYCRKLTAVGSTGLESSFSGLANAYSHIQSVSIATILPEVDSFSISTTTPSNLSQGSSGVQIHETTPWDSSWQKSVSFSRIGRSPNTNYCYQARSRNGDNLVANDITSLSSQSCKYTKAAVPARPNIQSLSGGTEVRLTLGVESPQNPGYTQYAVCVTRYNSDGTKNSKYALADSDNDGVTTVDWTGPDCVSSDASGYWARRDTGVVPNWGNTNGIVITGLIASTKYDFKAKAKNEENIYTAFGPQATLFLVKNNVVGWAWSSNIGWLSMNCLNMFIDPSQYGYSCSNASDWGMNTEFEATREINPLEGYAWTASGREIKESWTGRQNVSNTPGTASDGQSAFAQKPKADRNVAIDSNGYPHVAWIEQTALNTYKLYYARWNGNAWEDIDGSGLLTREVADAAGGTDAAVTLALDNQNQPHIIYKGTASTNWNLHWAWWNKGTSTWIDSVIPGSSGALLPSFRLYEPDSATHHPRLTWQAQHDGISDVMYAQWNGADWTNVDGTIPASPGNNCLAATNYCFDGPNDENHGFASLALDSLGRPNIAWGDDSGANFRIAYKYWDGAAWQNIGGQDGMTDALFPTAPEIYYPSIDVDGQNNPHIAWSMVRPGGVSNTRIYYAKGDKANNKWLAADGHELHMDGSNENDIVFINDTGDVAHSPSIVVDSQNRPHIAWSDQRGGTASQPEIYYRWWNQHANFDQGAWVTVSGAYGSNFSDANVLVSNSPTLDSFAPSLELDSAGRPNIVWQEKTDVVSANSMPDEIYYNGWRQSYPKAGLGWVSFFKYVCANNTQKGCSVVAAASVECGGAVGDDCIENVGSAQKSAGVQTPPVTTYGFCYNDAGLRYGKCSDKDAVCQDDKDLSMCNDAATAHCVYETCSSAAATCSDFGTGDETCRTTATANFNGITREIEGWGRSLTLKEEGLKQSHDDWGWLKLNGQYDNGLGDAGSYKITGTEVDSQSFLGDPDVNPNNVTLYSMFGWGWQGPGTANTNTGWFEFMPAGALLGIPWVQTMFADIHASESISLAPPPRGTGDYTSTYLIESGGSITGISGYFGGTTTGRPTSQLPEQPGFTPLVQNQPSIGTLGAELLGKLDADGLVGITNGNKNRHGHVVVETASAAGSTVDISTTGAFNPSAASPILNNKVYYFHGASLYRINSQMTFMRGDSGANPISYGNGVMVIDGDLEINADVLYDPTTNIVDLIELPSAAIIVRGNVYINSLVNNVSAVVVAVDNPSTAALTEGIISTGREAPAPVFINALADDTYVSYDGATYTNTIANNAVFGQPGLTDRSFLRFKLDTIPAGAEIKSAYLKLQTDTTGSGDFSARIYLLDGDNAAQPPTGVIDFTGTSALYNASTSNSVNYPISSSTWSTTSGAINQSPDLKALVQRFVNRSNYTQGNYIGLAIHEGDAAVGESRGFMTFDSGPANAPQLVIEYSLQRVTFDLQSEINNDVSAWSSGYDHSNLFGWNTASVRAQRTYLRFAGINVPPEAEIIQGHIRTTINGTGGTGFQVRQGLLDGYPAAFTANPWGTANLAAGVSEVAEDVATGSWANGSLVVMHDITKIVESFIGRADYSPGSADYSALGLRLRRGNDSTELTAGANEYRSITSLASKLDIDYRVPLSVSGLFVAETGYNFDRKYTKNLAPAEQILYDGRVVANTPPGLADFVQALPVYHRVTP